MVEVLAVIFVNEVVWFMVVCECGVVGMCDG